MADSCEDGEKWSEFGSLKTMKLKVYTDKLEVRMWEKEGGKNKPKGYDLNHQKDRIAKSSVFRCEASMRPSNRDMEWALEVWSGEKKSWLEIQIWKSSHV